MHNAAVTSVTPNPALIADANVGTAGFVLAVAYDEPMDVSQAPTVSFPAENPGTSLTLNPAQSGWTNNTTYLACYDVTDANADLPNIDVQVTGAKNANGNPQAPADRTDVFSIDTQDPLVANVVADTALIADSKVGAAAFTLTITFSESMSTVVAPTISFPVENPVTTLTLNTSQSAWANNTTYVAKYDVVDADVALADVDVRVTGARDLAGNFQEPRPRLVFSVSTRRTRQWPVSHRTSSRWATLRLGRPRSL